MMGTWYSVIIIITMIMKMTKMIMMKKGVIIMKMILIISMIMAMDCTTWTLFISIFFAELRPVDNTQKNITTGSNKAKMILFLLEIIKSYLTKNERNKQDMKP